MNRRFWIVKCMKWKLWRRSVLGKHDYLVVWDNGLLIILRSYMAFFIALIIFVQEFSCSSFSSRHLLIVRHYSYFLHCSVTLYETQNAQNIAYVKYTSERGLTNLGHQIAWATKFCAMTPNVVGSSEWNWLHVTLLAPINWRWRPYVWKVFVPLFHTRDHVWNNSG